MMAFLTARYKLIHFYGEGKGKDEGADIEYFELYDLLTDPHEMKMSIVIQHIRNMPID